MYCEEDADAAPASAAADRFVKTMLRRRAGALRTQKTLGLGLLTVKKQDEDVAQETPSKPPFQVRVLRRLRTMPGDSGDVFVFR